jgi:hypothetical protein
MKLNDALDWLNHNENLQVHEYSNICYITKQPIQDRIELACGHAFEYDSLLNHLIVTQRSVYSHHTCPYCRIKHNMYIPYHEGAVVVDRKYRSYMFKNNYIKCDYTFKSGKRKGESCNDCGHSFACGNYCFRHKSIIEKRKIKNTSCCKQLLKNGNPCTCIVFDLDDMLCKRHYNLKNKY